MIGKLAVFLVLLTTAMTARAAVTPHPGSVSQVDDAPSCMDALPDVAPLADGGFVTVWGSALGDSSLGPFQLLGRFLDRDGRPRGPAFRLDDGGTAGQLPIVATDAAGNFMVVWQERTTGALRGRVYSPSGAPLAADFVIEPPKSIYGLQIVAERDGGFTVLWLNQTTLLRRRYTAGGQPLGAAETLTSNLANLNYAAAAHGDHGVIAVWMEQGHQVRAGIFRPGSPAVLLPIHTYTPQAVARFAFGGPFFAVATRPDGVFLVAWRDVVGSQQTVFVRAFDGAGQPLGQPFRADEIARPETGLAGLDATVDAAGDFVVVWQAARPIPYERTLYVRAFGPDGAPRGPAAEAGDPAHDHYHPALASSRHGNRSLLVWQNGEHGDWPGIGVPPCFSDGIFAQPLSESASGNSLSLQDGRFQVRVVWSLPDGQTGRGQPVPLTRESGYFWFFGANNVELAVKILDGRIENGHFWVFYGSLSDVGYTITIDDTVTGATRTYVNPPSTLASRSDITAFPAAPPAASSESVVAESAPSHLPSGSGPCLDAFLSASRGTGLCLNGQRFEVEVAWHDPFHGTSGIGNAVPLTEDSGYFWFFGRDNLELVVKVLDGRSYNGKFWVFYGALTNVEYTIRVRHVDSGAERIYHNPPGQFRSRSDIDAFVLEE